MATRYDVCSPRPGREEGKTYWHRVGTGFDGEKGISVKLDSLPLPDAKGEVWLKLFEPREKSQGAGKAGADNETAPAARRPPDLVLRRPNNNGDLDDSIPF